MPGQLLNCGGSSFFFSFSRETDEGLQQQTTGEKSVLGEGVQGLLVSSPKLYDEECLEGLLERYVNW